MDQHITVIIVRNYVVNVLIIKASQLLFLSSTQMHARNLVDEKQQDTRDEKRPGGTSRCACQLQTKLPEVAIPPAALIRVAADSIESWYHFVGKETGQNVANISTDTVDCKDIEAVVDAEDVLVSNGVETAGGGDDPDKW